MLSRLFFVSCCVYVCLAADYDIIWDQNYCADQDRYPSSYKLPHNSPCSLCIDDVITFRINSTSNIYENLYRVPSETAMMNCNASTNENTNVYAFNDKQEITIRSGGSEPAFSFLFRAEPYYFISTSDGTQNSAENDLSRSPNTCLQFAFTVRLSNDPNCGDYMANCNFSSVFTDPPSLLQCSAATVTSPTTSSNTVSNPATTTTTTPPTGTQGLEIRIPIYVSTPISTLIPLYVLIAIVGILIIVIPLICIPILILYARGIICNSKSSNEASQATQSSPRFKRGGSSLDTLTNALPPDLDHLYAPSYDMKDGQAETKMD